ncbi:MAG: chromate transporter [Clostridia bacterium]|nr:chromate transporter [Clostridia bacterium]
MTVKKRSLIWEIFISLFKIGLFTFGGGYAMIALLENEYVTKRKWLEKEEFLDLVVIAESTPGPIAINASTYIGYKTAGLIGAIAGTVGMCLPSFIIIYIISLFLDSFLEISLIASAFRGIQVCVVYLILSAGIKMLKGMKRNALNISIVSAVIICMVLFALLSVNFSSIFYILISAVVGLAVYFAGLIRGKECGK